jgi:hypothetical protein
VRCQAQLGETQIARLARHGYANPKIGGQLFTSPRIGSADSRIEPLAPLGLNLGDAGRTGSSNAESQWQLLASSNIRECLIARMAHLAGRLVCGSR